MTRRQAVFLLNFVAGWVDGVGFLALAGMVQAFPSFMSGNSTKVVTDLVSGKLASAGAIAGIVLLFVSGAIFSRLVNDGSRRRETAALMSVAAILWLVTTGFVLGWSKDALLMLLALAMGMINRALQGSNGYTVHTFISGAVVTIGSDIADALSGRGEWKQVLLPLSIWSAVLLGAGAGGLVTITIGMLVALGVPAFVVTMLAIANGANWLEPAGEAKDGHLDAIEMHR